MTLHGKKENWHLDIESIGEKIFMSLFIAVNKIGKQKK